jgi:hypothetical protein
MSGKKRARDSNDTKEESPEPRSRPNIARSRAQNAKEVPNSSAKQGANSCGARESSEHFDANASRKTGTTVAANKRPREPKGDASKSLKQQPATGTAVATRTRAAAELSGATGDGSPSAHMTGVRATVVNTTPAPPCIAAPILVSAATTADARNMINPVLIPPAFTTGPISGSGIPSIATRAASFSPGLSAVAAVPALACSALKLPAPALTTFLPSVQGSQKCYLLATN